MSTTKIFLAVLLSAVNLAAAAPVTGDNSAVTSSLKKRINPASHCQLDMYPKIGQRAAIQNMHWLEADPKESDTPETVYVMQGTTTMISCQGQAGVYLSVAADPTGKNNKLPFQNSDLGHIIDGAYADCYGGPPAADDASVWAYQSFQNGYDLLVKGDANCDNFSQPS